MESNAGRSMSMPCLEAAACSTGPIQFIDWPALPGGAAFGWTQAEEKSIVPPVHLWAVSLDLPASIHSRLARTLAPAEQHRAARYQFETHRRRFIAGRGLLRALLGAYLDVAPANLDFVYGPYGKPALAHAYSGTRLEFNLAHAEHLALVAITRGAPIGVDIERVRTLPDADDLVERFFSPTEAAAFAQVPPAQKPEAFFNLWTRKEAWLKATGQGIAQYLSQVEVSFLPGRPAELMKLPETFSHEQQWHLWNLAPAAGFAAALAVVGPHTTPLGRNWNMPAEAAGGLQEDADAK